MGEEAIWAVNFIALRIALRCANGHTGFGPGQICPQRLVSHRSRLEVQVMAEERVQRRLAAILAADVAGYSRLMGEDEEGTLAALKLLRRELADPTDQRAPWPNRQNHW